jgi:isovaleryl-CoA dehydrogenase
MREATQRYGVDLSDEQAAFVDALRDFFARELDPSPRGDSEPEMHLEGLAKRLGDLGWYGLTIPEEYGGSGGSFLDLVLMLEETARAEAPIKAHSVTLIVASILRRFGSHDQKYALLPAAAAGGALAIAMSEADTGSDIASIKTRAIEDGDGWMITGSKMWCSWAHKADHILVVCRTDVEEDRHAGLSMLMVPRSAEGLRLNPIPTMGGANTCEVHLDGVTVPGSSLIGRRGEGWKQLMAGLDYERLIIAALAVGQARRSFEVGLAYVKQREQYGRSIGSFQVQRHRFADLLATIAQARVFVQWAAVRIDERNGGPFSQEASIAKLVATEAAKHCALECLQAMGGYGYASEYPMERYVREALVMPIYGGTSEIQRNIIARTLDL